MGKKILKDCQLNSTLVRCSIHKKRTLWSNNIGQLRPLHVSYRLKINTGISDSLRSPVGIQIILNSYCHKLVITY